MVTGNFPGPERPSDPAERVTEHLHLEEAEHLRETDIIVNGRPRKVPGRMVTYDEILQLAFPGPHNDPNVVFSMTYRHAAAHPSAGELGPGGAVKVREGTVFNVTRTVKS